MSNTELPAGIESELTLAQVAKAFHRSQRWVSDRMKRDDIEHTRHGNKITFTPAQFRAFQERDAVAPVSQPITTGRKKS